MPAQEDYLRANEAKASFDNIYDLNDPRAYFKELGKLDYQIPDRALPATEMVVSALRNTRDLLRPTILDIGCSYGINAALLKCGLSMDTLADRAQDGRELSDSQFVARDRAYFAKKSSEPLKMIGIDVASNAVEYAKSVGLLDDALMIDLENEELERQMTGALSKVDLILSTGCVGYITEKTFSRLLDATQEREPWILSYVLRMFPYDKIAATLSSNGYITEMLPFRTFVQRKFADGDEEEDVVRRLEKLGLSPDDVEEDGYYHAELYLSRPISEVERPPLSRLFRTL